jgi:type IV pilus modification protein PilV
MAEETHMDMRSRWQRGTTLVEAMVAMVVVAIGAAGAIGLHTQQLGMNGEARRITEATALAQDMVENMSLWAWDDARLADTNSGNNADIGDTAQAFETYTTTQAEAAADHKATDLGAAWTGLGGAPGYVARVGFERYWNVAASGSQKRIAVIVRWQQGSGWRRVVALTSRADLSGATGP